MMSALLKSLLWLLAEAACHISLTPPQKPTYKEDYVPTNGNWMNSLYKALPVWKVLSLSVSLSEILTIYSSNFRQITSYPTSCDAATVNSPFIASFILLSISFALRVHCYYTLGSLFTFETTIRPNHTLITTGPYHFVRHPSYTALYGVWFGQISMHVYTCDSWVVLRVFAITTICSFVVGLLLGLRTREEDEVLHKRFGAEWLSYSMRVPHRFIPRMI